jgi:hypothetical protein
MKIEKKELWEIIIPEPFILDPEIKEDFILANILKLEKEDQINEFMFTCLYPPSRRFVVFCTEKDVLKLFSNRNKLKLRYEIKETGEAGCYEGDKIIIVKDDTDNIIGRGVVNKLGSQIDFNELKITFSDHMKSFRERYLSGKKKIDVILFKIKSAKSRISQNLFEN